jgi:hypothetical protein
MDEQAWAVCYRFHPRDEWEIWDVFPTRPEAEEAAEEYEHETRNDEPRYIEVRPVDGDEWL